MKNLGTTERIVRPILGLLLAAALLTRPTMGAMEWSGMVIAGCLMLNGIFGRCYLWQALNISSCECRSDQHSWSDETSA